MEYEPQPCIVQHDQYRLLFWLDVGFVLLAACAVIVATRQRQTQPQAQPTELVPSSH
jgi:hypothetical protein